MNELEEKLAAAVEAYRTDPSEENKAAYTAASEELRDARQSARGGLVPDSDNATIVEPGPVAGSAGRVG